LTKNNKKSIILIAKIHKSYFMFGSGRETSSRSLDPAAEAVRTPGFPKFMEEFDDAHEISPDDADYTDIVAERLRIFKMLPEVTKAIQDLAVGENAKFLGRTFTAEELAGLGSELRRLVTKEGRFGLLTQLQTLVIRYRELPGQIAEQELLVASMGSREALEHRAIGINHQIARKETQIRDAEGSVEGMALAKEGVAKVKDLEKGVSLTENILLGESENIFRDYERSFKGLESAQNKLAEADKIYGQPGSVFMPDVSALKEKFQEVGKNKKDPAQYLEAITGFNFAASLEGLKQDIQKACQDRVGAFRKIQTKPKESVKYPRLHEAIIQLTDIKAEASAVKIDASLAGQAEALQNDLAQLEGVRQGLLHLEGDPGNRRIRLMTEQALGDFQTSTGRQLESRLKVGLAGLAETQDKLDGSPAGDDDIRFAVHHSRKGFMGRLISRDPEKRMRKTAEQAASDVENLETERQRLLDGIRTIEDADARLESLRFESQAARNALTGSLKIFGAMFKKSGAAAQAEIAGLVNSEDPIDVIKARGLVDKLIQAREDAPDLYGDMDDGPDNEIDTNLRGRQNLRDVRSNYSETLTVKVEEAIKKALESLTDAELNPESFAIKLVAFEDGLGSLADTADYKQIRFNAFKGVASRGSIFLASKKFVLGQMLREAGQRGFISGSNIDLKGFVNAVRPKTRAAA
jgi:hypothetical protein